MFVALSDEQAFLVDAAADALGRHDTLAAARAALDGAPRPDLWPLATSAGWTGLLAGEDADGAELGPYEAMLVLEACGRRLADAGLLGHLPATLLLEQAQADVALRRELAAGARRATLLDATLCQGDPVLLASVDGDGFVLDGTLRCVLDAPGADVFVVIARDDDSGEAVAAVCDATGPGITVEAVAGYDATRALGTVTLRDAHGHALALSKAQLATGADLQRALLAAESIGAADACLTMARDHAVDRFAFGRSIGSYQAIKHKLVEMLRRVEGGRSLLIGAGRAWDHDRDGFALLANAARVTATDALDYAAPENIFIHGGVGATWEHDASLYYRRAELSRRLAGGAESAAERVAGQLLDRVATRDGDPVGA